MKVYFNRNDLNTIATGFISDLKIVAESAFWRLVEFNLGAFFREGVGLMVILIR